MDCIKFFNFNKNIKNHLKKFAFKNIKSSVVCKKKKINKVNNANYINNVYKILTLLNFAKKKIKPSYYVNMLMKFYWLLLVL